MGYLLWLLLIFMTLLFSACSSQATPLPEAQLLTQVWQALQPNTSSYNRANREVVESQSLSEREASERFAGEPDPGCVPGLSAQNGGGSDFAVTVELPIHGRSARRRTLVGQDIVLPGSAEQTLSPVRACQAPRTSAIPRPVNFLRVSLIARSWKT